MRGIGILFKCGMRNSECGISGGEAMLRIVKNRVLFIHLRSIKIPPAHKKQEAFLQSKFICCSSHHRELLPRRL